MMGGHAPRAALLEEGLEDMDTSTTSSTGNTAEDQQQQPSGGGHQQRQQHRELLVPRGLDLLPSMRAPRRLPATKTTLSNGGNGNGGGGGGSSSEAGEQETGGAVEYVPWIRGSASLGGSGVVKAGRAGAAAAAAPAAGSGSEGIKERVRWFPRALPMKPTEVGSRGQDERESAIFNTRASMAIDRLGEQVGETTRRQAEMEAKRREKVTGQTDFARVNAPYPDRLKAIAGCV